MMEMDFIRSATFILRLDGTAILVDPMLNPAGAVEPVPQTPNPRRNPLVDLPFDDAALRRLLAGVGGVLVTHLHRDHWDPRAVELLARDLPIFCQPEDEARIRADGFAQVQPIGEAYEWRGVRFTRTAGQHGTGEIGRRMAPVSGFVLERAASPTLYIAGDTIWCPEVEEVLRRHRPAVTVVNAGGARFLTGDPIIMTAGDVVQVCRTAPNTRVVAVHLEALNHCLLSRAELRAALEREGLSGQVLIPADGETIDLDAAALAR
jgi:L-ascorbate metabolism protein UlaG (beta-lactamase superfamily)